MTLEQLIKVCQAQPFEPFVLHLADGRSVRVAHPEALAFSSRGRTVFVKPPRGAPEIVDLLLVVSIELSETTPRDGNEPDLTAVSP
ncbi:MAG TPA: hypothetical protein VGM03_09165 [Phycisphaerae bacterium]|jgi:hypothetical protein